MDRDTKIELLKILAMVIILIGLIIGIVWMNKEDKIGGEEKNNTEEISTNTSSEQNEEQNEEKNTENAENTENNENLPNEENAQNNENPEN